MREYFVLSRYYKNKRSERLWKEIDWEIPSERERLLMWGRRDREQERLRDMSVWVRKREREKELKELGVWVCEKLEKIEVASDSDALWDRERETRERNGEILKLCVCVWERERGTDRQRENKRERKRNRDW